MIIRQGSSGKEVGARKGEGFLQELPLEVLFDGNRTPLNARLRKMILIHDLAVEVASKAGRVADSPFDI